MDMTQLNNLSTSATITTVGAAIGPNTTDPFYQYFHGVGFSPMLLLYYTPAFLLATIAVTFNCTLLYVTVKTKNLHNSFNILIALDSFASTMIEVNNISPFFIALFGINYIGSKPCFFLSLPTTFGTVTTPITMLYVGLERLCNLVLPIWVKGISATKSKMLLYVGFVIININTGYNVTIIYQGTINDFRNMEVRCSMGDNDNKPVWVSAIIYRNALVVLGATIAVYTIFCLLILRAVWKKTQFTAYNWHIIKAVSVIMALILFGFVINGASIYYLPLFHLNAVQRLVASRILTDLTLFASGCNSPVLYIFSADYRRAFKKELKCFCRSSNNVNIASITHISRHRQQLAGGPIH